MEVVIGYHLFEWLRIDLVHNFVVVGGSGVVNVLFGLFYRTFAHITRCSYWLFPVNIWLESGKVLWFDRLKLRRHGLKTLYDFSFGREWHRAILVKSSRNAGMETDPSTKKCIANPHFSQLEFKCGIDDLTNVHVYRRLCHYFIRHLCK